MPIERHRQHFAVSTDASKLDIETIHDADIYKKLQKEK